MYVDIRWWYFTSNQTSSTNEPLANKNQGARSPPPPRNQALDEAQEDEKRKLSRVKVRTRRSSTSWKLYQWLGFLSETGYPVSGAYPKNKNVTKVYVSILHYYMKKSIERWCLHFRFGLHVLFTLAGPGGTTKKAGWRWKAIPVARAKELIHVDHTAAQGPLF